METIGERLKRLRLEKKLTLQEVAEFLGTSKGNISSYENNKFKPASDSIVDLSKLFNVSADYILTGIEFTKNESVSSSKSQNSTFELSDDEKNIIDLYRKLNTREQIKLEGYIEGKLSIGTTTTSTFNKKLIDKEKKSLVTTL